MKSKTYQKNTKPPERIIFWCEFPKEINWNLMNKLIDFPTEVYFAAKSRKEYLSYKKKIKNKFIKAGAWPVLDKKDGYWFSGYTSKKNIDKLKQFNGINIKIDIEPPIIKGNYNLWLLFRWLFPAIIKNSKNKDYLKKIVYKLNKTNTIILSGFPFPRFILKRFGDDLELKENICKSYMFYSSFSPVLFKHLDYLYFRYFIKNKLKLHKEKVYFALGLIGYGIYKTEPFYKNIKELQKDINFVKKLGLKRIVVYSLESILKRKNPKAWLEIIKHF